MNAATMTQPYRGPERRRHRVFVTRNTEYHCRDGVCVAVRDLRTHAFLPRHPALGKKVTASFELSTDGGISGVHAPEEIRIGEQLCLSSGRGDLEHDVLTTPLRAIERPPREVVTSYYPREAV